MADLSTNLAVPARAVAVAAHPDDNDFGCAATAAKWTAAGCAFTYIVATDGSKGTWSREQDPAELVPLREQEQRAAGDVLGVERVVFLRHTDGELENTMALRRELAQWLRVLRPTVVLTHDPWRRYLLHPDHRAIGMATCDAVVASRDHLFFPEQLQGDVDAWRPERILLYMTDTADHWEDVEATFDRKIEALRAHASQHRSTMGEDWGQFVDRMAARAREMGEAPGFAAAEGFHSVLTG
jgi:LmbE family N-acetylglucosaminyl deacetylase